MKVELPSGETIELRDKLKAKDKFTVQSAVTLRMNSSGTLADQRVSGSTMTLMETSLMSRLIESWSLDADIPSKHSCPECMGDSSLWHQHVADFIGDTLDLDDYNKLEEIITPLLEKVMAVPNLGTSSG